MSKNHKADELTIRFPNEESLRRFAVWLCDGGGEQGFFDFEERTPARGRITRMQYHAENPKFATYDGRRYGPFIADRLIIAHAGRF